MPDRESGSDGATLVAWHRCRATVAACKPLSRTQTRTSTTTPSHERNTVWLASPQLSEAAIHPTRRATSRGLVSAIDGAQRGVDCVGEIVGVPRCWCPALFSVVAAALLLANAVQPRCGRTSAIAVASTDIAAKNTPCARYRRGQHAWSPLPNRRVSPKRSRTQGNQAYNPQSDHRAGGLVQRGLSVAPCIAPWLLLCRRAR